MLKVVIFDMDGVIFDSIPIARKFFMGTHPSLTDEQYRKIGYGNAHEEALKFAHLRISETLEEQERRRVEYVEAKSSAPIFRGMKELLEDLQREGIMLAINTSAYERNCLSLLVHSQIINLFSFIGTAEVSKNKEEKFAMILTHHNIAPEDVIFVTDTVGDILEAKLVHIPTIAVTWGMHDERDFMMEKHSNLIGIVNSVDGLRAIFGLKSRTTGNG